MTLRASIGTSLAAILLALPALAESSLIGREVSFQIRTFDTPETLLFEGRVHRARVGDKPEFGLRTEGVQNDLDVVPVIVDITADRIEIDYAFAPPGELWAAAFNGYVLSFAAPCQVLGGARVDPGFTTLAFDNKRLRVEGNTLLLNVSALRHDTGSRIGIDLDLRACPDT